MLPEFCRTSQTHATCSCVKPNMKGSPPAPLEACLSATVGGRATGDRCAAAAAAQEAAAATGDSPAVGGMVVD